MPEFPESNTPNTNSKESNMTDHVTPSDSLPGGASIGEFAGFNDYTCPVCGNHDKDCTCQNTNTKENTMNIDDGWTANELAAYHQGICPHSQQDEGDLNYDCGKCDDLTMKIHEDTNQKENTTMEITEFNQLTSLTKDEVTQVIANMSDDHDLFHSAEAVLSHLETMEELQDLVPTVEDQTLDTWMEQYREVGFEIRENGPSIYESEEEFQWNLDALTKQEDVIQEEINNRHTNSKENTTMSITEASTACVAINKGNHQKCGNHQPKIIVPVMVKAGEAVHEDLYKSGNLVGWFRHELPFCKTHGNQLLKGKKVQIQSLKARPEQLTIEVPTTKKEKKTMSTTKRILCGNCRKNGVEDPYHDTREEVAACFGVERKSSFKTSTPLVREHPNSTEEWKETWEEADALAKSHVGVESGVRHAKNGHGAWAWWKNS